MPCLRELRIRPEATDVSSVGYAVVFKLDEANAYRPISWLMPRSKSSRPNAMHRRSQNCDRNWLGCQKLAALKEFSLGVCEAGSLPLATRILTDVITCLARTKPGSKQESENYRLNLSLTLWQASLSSPIVRMQVITETVLIYLPL